MNGSNDVGIDPRMVQKNVQRGFKRLENFRNARLMFIRQYVGQYFDKSHGEIGTEALNLIHNAVRTMLPYLVMNYPKASVESSYLSSKEYGDLLALALDYSSRSLKIKTVYRRAIVDAIFTLGILKTGLAESDSVYAFDEYNRIDTGTVYTDAVDFDNFVADPNSKEHLFADAAFLGDRLCVPRANLLDSGLYKNDLVEQLPGAYDESREDCASDLSMNNLNHDDDDLNDYVEIAELWVPRAKAIVTVPAGVDISFDDYLRVDDYYGPDEGPYTFLAFSPPTPGNPLPVPFVGIWHDLHVLANKMAKKIMEQAERQKDVMAYKRSAADDAKELFDAADGESVAVDDPEAVRVHQLGGQAQSNEVHLAQLQNWFNMMAANPQGIAGERLDAGSATEARILQGNASIGLEDAKDIVYDFAANEHHKRAWYFHTDPFIQIPLIRRDQIPAQMGMGPMGPQMIPPQMVDRQVMLTPEARRGDFLDFTFKIQAESLGRMDSQRRLALAVDFAVKILPAATMAAQNMMMLGIPFDAKAYIVRMAKDAGIEWMEEVFYDPDFQMKMQMRMMAGPNPQTSKGQPGQENGLMDAIIQNGQPGQVMGGAPGPVMQQNQEFQSGANPGQQMIQRGY